ncbi:MAG: hypothetical protein HN764_10695, partial [Gammaproteobacteria bacterium]|nr:hypothetical protein [Gammaproteobacteria bacterium]
DFTQPTQWYLPPHPAYPNEIGKIDEHGNIQEGLFTFASFDFYSELKRKKIENALILIGTKESFSVWSVSDSETTLSGSQMLLLRSRKVIGALPKILTDNIPAQSREHILKQLQILSDDIYRASPESIVDCSREALTSILSTYMPQMKMTKPGKDLGELAGLLENHNSNDNVIIYSLAKAVARLHPRRKSAEQERNPTLREVHERDAELAVQVVGTVLCELSWANW